ncbi:Protein STICHEL-like 3 [Hibiscus syriacus]|uniref:Protein STICHEL-like 3 n=1 Tax=Hibiscus syriacus TaxID=106335 RepID=A0A6A3BWR1_HIBSY|nr:protein STICHEL-like 3 [Hibiscus syriacus]XP_039065096.1 protein STICHEL-like 3 [Hibiscus syriacus]XP_039065097.1 protein STICHEL-like 3 [Hibiscus syriacus]XP_039065098.1 protein STICHEL-like 3 [Hibiscus syriacus]KAE8719888.1 Protein STICHEL-like 3 [Hibiscus syriacus]
MNRGVGDRVLKDANGKVSDHLRNHIHLTNCIHLNHMHKHSPMLADRSLMRDLIVLQRSRSLRDPSASPPPWHSPSVVDLLYKKGNKDAVQKGRRSLGLEKQTDGRRLTASSPPLDDFAASKVAMGEASVVPATSDRSNRSRARDSRRIRREESGRRSSRVDLMGETKEPVIEQDGNDLPPDAISGNSGLKNRKSKNAKGKQAQGFQIKTLSEQLNDLPVDNDDVPSSNANLCGRHISPEKTRGEPEVAIRGQSSGLNRGRRRKFRGTRRSRAAPSSREVGGQNELSVASNSFAQDSLHQKYGMEDEENKYDDRNVTRAPRNGCGIPFNWSRIHHRGKTFLDIAGRSFSCGLSDSRLSKGRAGSHGRNAPEMPVESDPSSLSAKSEAEALPLLIEASGSLDSPENARWVNDYSGELGIFSDNLLKRNADSNLASEARFGEHRKPGGNLRGRHQNITQKYMPRTFRDLVGQNLASQALSNAVMKRKVGFLYVFYGPHGTGKTSCARIFARALNCQSPEQPKPCGFCNSCISHDMGKNRNIREVGPISNFDFESIMDLLDNTIISQLPSPYRVFIFDDCDTLSPNCWSAISKVTDRVPRRVVFILVSSSLDILPHIIVSRCQKFFFPKLKDSDIIYTLEWIASREDIEIEKDALKLIASRSDGSLRDAEMILEQLSLLGQKISVLLVQELVGLISDEKLVDLLDLALSADTVNTVKSLRVIMETGVEPLALMSQLATVITDILAGSYDFTKERHRRKFFRRQPLSKEDMEKLRQALKTLSEAEKQLRMSNDKLTWLTAALLQLAPDQQYILPTSSGGTSSHHSPLLLSDADRRDELRNGSRGLPKNSRSENLHAGNSGDFGTNMVNGIHFDKKRQALPGMAPQQTSTAPTVRQNLVKNCKGLEEIWFQVLEKILVSSLKEFLYQEGKLISVSFGAAPTVQLMFSSRMTKSKAEKFMGHISQAFESVLGSSVTIEIRCEARKDSGAGFHGLLGLPASNGGPSQMVMDPGSNSGNRMHRAGVGSQVQPLHHESLDAGGEIVEIPASPREPKGNERADNLNRRGLTLADAVAYRKPTLASTTGRRKPEELSHSRSIVRSKVSLAHVIQQAEGCTQRNGWSKRKAVSIAEKLEQENLRLEPRSKSLLCWKATRVTRRKLSRLKIRTRRPRSLLKLIACGKCLV